jgi:hypothetical protein
MNVELTQTKAPQWALRLLLVGGQHSSAFDIFVGVSEERKHCSKLP